MTRRRTDFALFDTSQATVGERLALSRKTIVVGAVVLLTFYSIFALRYTYSTAAVGSHSLGIIGTLLMLQTEIFYTWRKKGVVTIWSIKRWLQLHIVTGLLGPALILWHADWSFPGFAGLVTYLTIAVVASGVFGRYVYRSIPRTLRGEERTSEDLAEEQAELELSLREMLADEPEALATILRLEILTPRGRGMLELVYAALDYYSARKAIHRRVTSLGHGKLAAYKQFEEVALRRLALERRILALSASKRLLSNWNALHKPLTLTLFYAIGIHVASIMYYGWSL